MLVKVLLNAVILKLSIFLTVKDSQLSLYLLHENVATKVYLRVNDYKNFVKLLSVLQHANVWGFSEIPEKNLKVFESERS